MYVYSVNEFLKCSKNLIFFETVSLLQEHNVHEHVSKLCHELISIIKYY